MGIDMYLLPILVVSEDDCAVGGKYLRFCLASVSYTED